MSHVQEDRGSPNESHSEEEIEAEQNHNLNEEESNADYRRTDFILQNVIKQEYGEKKTIDIDHVNFVMMFQGNARDRTRETAMTMLANMYGINSYADLYNIRPLSDGGLWSFMKENALLPECAQKREILLLKCPINIAILKNEAVRFMKYLNKRRHGVPTNPNWRRFGFLVDTMSSANTPWFVDILEAMLEAQLSYMHVVRIGMRWHIGAKFRPAESFFELLTKAKDEGGVNILQIQFDIAITTHHTDEERSENGALYKLPKWRTVLAMDDLLINRVAQSLLHFLQTAMHMSQGMLYQDYLIPTGTYYQTLLFKSRE
eukprot:scaffold251713_cov56-Attheya_sp.AAC.1